MSGPKTISMIEQIKDEFLYYKALTENPSTPGISRWLLLAATAYLFSPFDFVPDFIPVLGQLDDLILVPFLVYMALLFIPPEIKIQTRDEYCRSEG